MPQVSTQVTRLEAGGIGAFNGAVTNLQQGKAAEKPTMHQCLM
jgi:hypothetical protein